MLVSPFEGTLHLHEEVAIERRADGELVIISPEPVAEGETITIDIPLSDSVESLTARVVHADPVLVEGVLRHRLGLEVVAPDGEPDEVDLPVEGGAVR
jgi:hypothetical protein